jgi:hypothetical protein
VGMKRHPYATGITAGVLLNLAAMLLAQLF